jgi:hypothetical protein
MPKGEFVGRACSLHRAVYTVGQFAQFVQGSLHSRVVFIVCTRLGFVINVKL